MIKLKELIKEWTDTKSVNKPRRWGKSPNDPDGLTEFERTGGKDKQINEGGPMDIRSAFYDLGDKIENLEWVNKRHTALKNDKMIAKTAKQMKKLHDQLNKYLDKTYQGWD